MDHETLCPDCHCWMPLSISAATTVRYLCLSCFNARMARANQKGQQDESPPRAQDCPQESPAALSSLPVAHLEPCPALYGTA